MRNFKPLSLLALAAVALLLAACGGQTPKAVVPKGFTSLQLSLAKSSFSTQSLKTLGSPYDPSTGNIAVDQVQVTVTDEGGNTVHFNYNSGTYTATTSGGTTVINLSPSTQSVTVAVPDSGNPYTFVSLGKASGTVVAYDTLTQDVSALSNVVIKLASLIDSATLTSRLPVHQAYPGAIIDLLLTVKIGQFQVPISDFTVDYGPLSGVTKVDASNRGIRVKVNNTCSGSVAVKGNVNGLVNNGGTYEDGTVAINGGSGYSLECPTNTGNMSVDIEPPTISLDSYDGDGTVYGNADDTVGLKKVQLYDGPVLIASSDPSEYSDSSVGKISFITNYNSDPQGASDNATDFKAVLESTTTTRGSIQGVAFDFAGNESDSNVVGDQNFVYVSTTGNDSSGDGSPANPFKTIQKGVGTVKPSGTVYVLPGTYNENVTISQPLTLEGEDASTTFIQGTLLTDNGVPSGVNYPDWLNTHGSPDSTSGTGITIASNNVTVENLKVQGFYYGVHLTGATTGTGQDATDITLQNVTINNAEVGIKVLTNAGGDASGFQLLGGSINNTIIGMYAAFASSTPTTFSNVTIDGTVFNHDTFKGIYLEALDNSTIKNVTITDSGNFGGQPGSNQLGLWGAGININLKYANYSNITLDNVTVTNSGLSAGGGSSDPNGAAVVLEARDDAPSYNADPASLDSVTIENSSFTGGIVGFRTGEPGKYNATPTNVVIKNSTVQGSDYDIIDDSTADITATDGNTLSSPAKIYDYYDDNQLGVVHH